MPEESAKDTGQQDQDRVESLIDELIRAIMEEAGGSPESSMGGKASAASLLEAAFASTLASSRTSMLERLLIAETFGSALAETLAPVLADILAPRLMEHVERTMTRESSGNKRQAGTASPGGAGRSPESR